MKTYIITSILDDDVEVVIPLPPENWSTSEPTVIVKVAESSPTTCRSSSSAFANLLPPAEIPNSLASFLKSLIVLFLKFSGCLLSPEEKSPPSLLPSLSNFKLSKTRSS